MLCSLLLFTFISTGDIRVNQNTHLTALHVILLRDHNKIAATFAKLNPHWSDEKTYQEARRILIAKCQYISYYEHLPNLLGIYCIFSNLTYIHLYMLLLVPLKIGMVPSCQVRLY